MKRERTKQRAFPFCQPSCKTRCVNGCLIRFPKDGCGHPKSDHEKYGPKKPHEKSSLYSKQLASSIRWAIWPDTNGPYTLFPTPNIEAFCTQPLCTCLKFIGNGELCGVSLRLPKTRKHNARKSIDSVRHETNKEKQR